MLYNRGVKQQDIFAWIATTKSDARLDVRIPQELLEDLERYAAERNWSTSFAVKVLLVKAIRKGKP